PATAGSIRRIKPQVGAERADRVRGTPRGRPQPRPRPARLTPEGAIMTSAITGLTTGASTTKGTSITTSGTTTSATAGSKNLDENAFLKLLVAQMRYQDPSKPMDTNEMMSQTATFTQVEKLTSLLTTQQNLLSAQHMQAASAMVGRSITYTATDGTMA